MSNLPTFLRFTGLRVGETMMLRWVDLDMGRSLLTIDAAITKDTRDRIVPISPHLVEALSACRQTPSG